MGHKSLKRNLGARKDLPEMAGKKILPKFEKRTRKARQKAGLIQGLKPKPTIGPKAKPTIGPKPKPKLRLKLKVGKPRKPKKPKVDKPSRKTAKAEVENGEKEKNDPEDPYVKLQEDLKKLKKPEDRYKRF